MKHHAQLTHLAKHMIDAGTDGGAWRLPYRAPDREDTIWLKVVASWGLGWDHVSVTVIDKKRCPTWGEMCFVKEIFFEDYEWAMQLHPPAQHNINWHDYCLHMWAPQGKDIPQPPRIGV